MYKTCLFFFVGLLLLSCEIHRRDTANSSGNAFRSSGNDTSALFSIRRAQNDSTRIPSLTETRENTTINSTVLSPQLPASLYEIVTPLGNMTFRLYDDTPANRDNFKRLVEDGFYEGTRFHKVIDNYMIQGGDPNSRDDDPNNDGMGGPGYTTPAEFRLNHYHKKGALAAARQSDQFNPERRSSGSQFYIVEGRRYTDPELTEIEKYIGIQIQDSNFKFSQEAREAYKNIGGTPTLDMQFTVFGELVDGFDVLERISSVPTDSRDRPKDDIPVTIRAIPLQ